jgi:hypothetical protein
LETLWSLRTLFEREGENLDDDDVKKSKDLYDLLVKKEIIQPCDSRNLRKRRLRRRLMSLWIRQWQMR